MVTTFLGVLAHRFTASGLLVGALLGCQGALALLLPVFIGSWSDRVRTRLGGRLPFVLTGAVISAGALITIGLARSPVPLAVGTIAFFAGYFIFYEPYRALYPDHVSADVAGRAQAAQAVWRTIGSLSALLGGGLLYVLWRPLPFLVCAALVGLAALALLVWTRRLLPGERRTDDEAARSLLRSLWSSVRRERKLHAFLIANALWEFALSALRAFSLLFLVTGLGVDTATAALLIAGVFVAAVPGAAVAGRLADRFGAAYVMRVGATVYGLGLLIPFFTQSAPVLIAVAPIIVFGGALTLALPYTALIPLMPVGMRGGWTGLYSFSRGFGMLLGPLTAGVAIDLLRPALPGANGYAVVWLIAAGAVLLSIPALRVIEAADLLSDVRGGDSRQ
jgi:MFS family permease